MDVFDFQRRYPTREMREKALGSMSSAEIRHIAGTCGTPAGRAYYNRFAEQAAFRELIGPIAEDLERVWYEGKKKQMEDL